MALPDTACIAFRLSTAVYRPLFEEVWGAGSLDIKFPNNTESICETPGGASVFGTNTTPIPLKPEDRVRANDVFDHWGESLEYHRDLFSGSSVSQMRTDEPEREISAKAIVLCVIQKRSEEILAVCQWHLPQRERFRRRR